MNDDDDIDNFGDKKTVNEKLKGGKLKFLKRWENSKYLDCLVLRLGHVSRWEKSCKNTLNSHDGFYIYHKTPDCYISP